MISDSKKFIFIHIPKTGGSSIEVCLNEYSADTIIGTDRTVQVICHKTGHNYKHAPIQQYKDMYDNKIDDYFKFTVIRNPWERVLSLYCWMISGSSFNKNNFIDKIKSEAIKQPGESAWAPMTNHIYQDDNLLIDEIIRFENLNNGFQNVMKKLDINVQLPHINKSSHKHYSEYYDDETKAIVDQYYKKDIELFGYKFEIEEKK